MLHIHSKWRAVQGALTGSFFSNAHVIDSLGAKRIDYATEKWGSIFTWRVETGVDPIEAAWTSENESHVIAGYIMSADQIFGEHYVGADVVVGVASIDPTENGAGLSRWIGAVRSDFPNLAPRNLRARWRDPNLEAKSNLDVVALRYEVSGAERVEDLAKPRSVGEITEKFGESLTGLSLMYHKTVINLCRGSRHSTTCWTGVLECR
jgi:hypothetical protein